MLCRTTITINIKGGGGTAFPVSPARTRNEQAVNKNDSESGEVLRLTKICVAVISLRSRSEKLIADLRQTGHLIPTSFDSETN